MEKQREGFGDGSTKRREEEEQRQAEHTNINVAIKCTVHEKMILALQIILLHPAQPRLQPVSFYDLEDTELNQVGWWQFKPR